MFINRLRVQPLHTQTVHWPDKAWEIHGKPTAYHEERSTFSLLSKLVSFHLFPRTAEVSITAIISDIIHNLCNNLFLLLFFLYVYRDPTTAPEQTTNRVSLCYEPWCTNHYVYDP